MSKLMNETKTLLTNVRLSYANLFEPKGFDGQEPKYSTAILIDKEDEEAVKVIQSAVKNAVAYKWNTKPPKNLKTPLRDGDEERPDDEVYAGHYFFNASSKIAPQVVDRYKDPKTGKPIALDEDEVYSGCYVNATINFYAFDVSGNRGVAAGLGNVQKVKDGERLGGGSTAENDFDFEEADALDLGSDDDWLS